MSATPQSAEPDLPTKKLAVPVTTAAAADRVTTV